MGIMSKIKGILFDEEEIEVPIDNDELPERTKEVKKESKKMSGGVIDYHNRDLEEEDTIKEIIIPDEERAEKLKSESSKEQSHFNLVDDEEIERDFPTKRMSFDSTSEDTFPFDVDSIHDEVNSREENYSRQSRSVEDVRKEYNIGTPIKTHTEEIKDYRKMLNHETDSNGDKKPFVVTPVISPVYGVLDKNYTADDVVEKRELINKTNSGVKPRSFGPVSYNDQPLPTPKKKSTSLKSDLVELNETINELINDSITPENVEVESKEVKVSEPKIEEEERFEDTSEMIIKTDNYDDYETNSIESDVSTQNNIEDAFDSTEELHSIKAHDEELKTSESSDTTENNDDVVNFDDIVEKPSEGDDDMAELDNTIETDLFNLIDSMYKSDDQETEDE